MSAQKYYPRGDQLTQPERLHFRLTVAQSFGAEGREIKAKKLPEYRTPRAGEWYLSGAEPAAYRAVSGLHTCYWICKLVRVKTVTTVVEIEEAA